MTEREIRDLVKPLTQDGTFSVKSVTTDDRNFGNAMIILSQDRLEVNLVHDRANTWCQCMCPHGDFNLVVYIEIVGTNFEEGRMVALRLCRMMRFGLSIAAAQTSHHGSSWYAFPFCDA